MNDENDFQTPQVTDLDLQCVKDKIKVIEEVKAPWNVLELKSFLSVIYYCLLPILSIFPLPLHYIQQKILLMPNREQKQNLLQSEAIVLHAYMELQPCYLT